jgi:hypothetical protein
MVGNFIFIIWKMDQFLKYVVQQATTFFKQIKIYIYY